jgi:hypothetical protein
VHRQTLAFSAVVLVVGVSGCGERVPSELRPGFDALVLESNFCGVALPAIELLVRNVGDDPVTIEGAAFAAVAGHEADVEHFTAPELDETKLLAEEEAFVRFTYATPGGVGQKVDLVITSDAAVNPTLTIPTETVEFLPANPDDVDRVCDGGEGEGEGEGEGDGG